MKKIVSIIAVALTAFAVMSCDKSENKPVETTVQLMYSSTLFDASDAEISVTDLAETVTYNATTSGGSAVFSLKPGSYTARCTYKTVEDGKRAAYTGESTITVLPKTVGTYNITLSRSESQQIIIKEVYNGGCPKNDGTGSYSNDAYIILYNNSEFEADATDIQFTFAAPYNGNGANKYLGTDGKLSYESESWIPAYGAIWWFTSDVKIAPYSQIVVACFGAIDHTATYTNSVNLANSAYYVMSNSGVTQYTNAKYAVADVVPSTHYLTCSPFTQGNAWALSNASPAFYIGKATKEEGLAWSTNADAYDHTMGTSAAFNVVKYPKADVIDAVEIWSAANIAKSNSRFPATVNTGYVALTNAKGYTIYRNVDKEATEALTENAGKIVYNYAGGTTDVEGTTDPSGIDAEASIAAGAHIIYSDTNNSATDFHQRKTASLKK